MPRWFIIWSVVAALGALFSMLGDLVLITTLFSFGLMIPVWFIAANLWWAMVVAAPSVWFWRHNRPVLGGSISAGVLVMFVVGFTWTVSNQRTALMPTPFVARSASALNNDPPRSIEIFWSGLKSDRRDCDVLCERLLTGPDILWLRISHAQTWQEPAHSMIYYRAPAADCAALHPGFDPNVPCLLARPDEIARADLMLDINQTGDFYGPMAPETDLVYATGTESLTLTDQRGTA